MKDCGWHLIQFKATYYDLSAFPDPATKTLKYELRGIGDKSADNGFSGSMGSPLSEAESFLYVQLKFERFIYPR